MGRPKATSATKRQAEWLAAYREYFKKNRIPPSLHDVAEALGISPAASRLLAKSLAEHGLVTRVAVGARGVALTSAGEAFGGTSRRKAR